MQRFSGVRGENDAETDRVRRTIRVLRFAGRTSAFGRSIDPTAAANDLQSAAYGASRVGARRVEIVVVVVPIGHPLEDVAVNVV